MTSKVRLTVAFFFILNVALYAAQPERPLTPNPSPSRGRGEPERQVPEKVAAAVAALASDSRPQVLMGTENGAIYALLPNGCEIIVKEKHSAPVVTVQAWVRTGAIDEGQWLGAGLSHFCEHMLFKGTAKRAAGVIDQDIRGAGGDDNAYTSSERTVFHVTSSADGFDTAFDVLGDLVMNSNFPPAETTKEHAVVYKEIERYQDNPDAVLFEKYEQTLYQEHPYRVPVLGYPDRFKRVTRDEVYAYYQQRYSPQLTTFITVGDFDASVILPKMAKALAGWQRKSIAPVAVTEEPEQVAPRSVQISHPLCEVPKLVMGFPSVSIRHPDLYALDVLASILGDGRSSRMYRIVKDKLGLVTEISVSDYTPMYAGHFDVSATVDSGKIEDAQNAILNVIEDAKGKKPSDEELDRAKRKVYTQRIFAQMTVDGEASTLGSDWQNTGDLDFAKHYADRVQQVTAEDVVRVAKKYLTREKLNVAVLLPVVAPASAPAGKHAGTTTAGTEAGATTAEQISLKAELDLLRQNPAVEKVNLLEKQGVFEVTLKASGLRLVVKVDHSLPVVNVAIAALGGMRWEPAPTAGASNMLSEMLDRGTAKRSKQQIAEQAEDLGSSLSTFSGRNSLGVTVSGLSRDAQKLMDLASDCVLHPSFPPEELEKLRADVLQAIAQEDESMFTLNSKILRPLLYGDSPYARQTLGTPETVKKITAEDLRKLHEQWFQPENMSIGFVGDISVADALKLTSQSFDALKPGHFKAPSVPPISQLTGVKKGEQEKADLTGAVLTMGFRGVNLLDPDREKLDLISAVLSGIGGRLYVTLREKQSLAYAVGSYNDAELDGGAMVFYIQTDAKSLEKSETGMLGEVKKLRDELIPEAEVKSVKNFLDGTEAIELQNQGALAQRLALSELYGEGAGRIFSRRERLAKITPADIKAAAEKYLTPEKYAEAVLKAK
ncbi:MAG TPA: pitrilysin family protein [Planctomycetota bacterium]|jgi:zinc protease